MSLDPEKLKSAREVGEMVTAVSQLPYFAEDPATASTVALGEGFANIFGKVEGIDKESVAYVLYNLGAALVVRFSDNISEKPILLSVAMAFVIAAGKLLED